MGCDMHIRTEINIGEINEPEWFCADYYRKNKNFFSYRFSDEEDEWEVIEIYNARNYCLFSLLANVRQNENCPNKCICEPKGIPDNICEEIKIDVLDWGESGHSHSYFTLSELIDAKKTIKSIKRCGFISEQDAENLDKNGTLPVSYCSFPAKDGSKYREWEEKNDLLDPIIKALKKRYVEFFPLSYVQSDRIRIVFWFDD